MAEGDITESFDLGKISAHIYLIKLGVRPVALETVRNDSLDRIIEYLRKHGVSFVKHKISDIFSDIYIYLPKNRHLAIIINCIRKKDFGNQIFIHWVWGRLLGYPEESIYRFLYHLGLLDESENTGATETTEDNDNGG